MAITSEEIRVDADVKELLDSLAEAEKKSRSEILREALEAYRQTKSEASPPTSEEEKPRPRKPGNAKGKGWMSEDFDEPLEEFKDYM